MTIKQFFPFLSWLPLAKKSLKDDLIAGIIGTIIVIPQAVAFAIIAGLPPIYGFYTSMVTPIIAALFGSSYQIISGPTTAISIVVFATISKMADPVNEMETYVMLTLVLTFLAGLFQFLMGLARMGKLVNFVSHSVIIGFTAGAGILIAVKQLKYVFGIDVPRGSHFYEILLYIYHHINQTNIYVFAVAMSTIILALVIKLLIKPLSRYYMLISMIIGSFLAVYLGGDVHGIETVGQIPSHLPPFQVPELTWSNITKLSGGASIVALMGLIQTIAVGRAIALSTHQKIDSNQEFIGHGISNMVASFFSSYAGSGSFTRSGVNHQAGAKTPMSAIFSAVFLAVVLLLFADYAAFLPKAAMGGIILLVGYNLIEFKHIAQAFKSSKRELFILVITLVGTLFLELEIALLFGILASLFFYLERTSHPNIATLALDKNHRFTNIIRSDDLKVCPQLEIVRFDGSIYFGAIESIADFFSRCYDKKEVKNVLLVADGVNFIDLAGAEWLTHEALKWQERGGGIHIVGLKLTAQSVLIKGGFIDKIGPQYFHKNKRSAIEKIYQTLDKSICETCQVKAFYECGAEEAET